jgi:hypothetical protein
MSDKVKFDYKLSAEERETIIRGNSASKQWEVVTSDPRIIAKMGKQGYKPNGVTNPWGYESYTLDYNRVRIANIAKRKVSEAQREATRARFAAAREALKNKQLP